MIKVLIVEDDPMVAELNKKFVNHVKGFQVEAIAGTVGAAKEFLQDRNADLILLDVYMPGENGLELLKYIRETDQKMDVILITAATDMMTVQEAVRLGSVDYLIKPFSFLRLNEALLSYQNKQDFMKVKRSVSQEDLDSNLFSKPAVTVVRELPKGLTRATLKIILAEIKKLSGIPFESEELARRTGISSVSVREYLNFLNDIRAVESKVSHGAVGRPSIHFIFKEDNEIKIFEFL